MLPLERKRPVFERRPMQFPHESNDRAQQKQNVSAATPSEPSMTRGRNVSKKRSIRGKSNHGAILRQPCRTNLKGTCTRTSYEYWYPPDCQFFYNESGCKAGKKCLFPHYKVDEQRLADILTKSRKRATNLQK